MQHDRTKLILGAIVFISSLVLYLATVAPTVSFWDTGEFIACAYTLGVPHPPGSPLFILIGRFFTLLPTSVDPAFRMNIISPLSAALANLLVFLIIVKFVKIWRGGDLESTKDKIIAYVGAFIGAMGFAGTDSHWFNSVEAEVYAMSTFATALVVWLILRWMERSDRLGHERYLLLIAYVMGLAIGVHLLNLLTLPVIALVIYFKKYKFQWSSFFATVAITLGAFLAVYLGIIKGLAKVMAVTYAGGYFGFYLVGLIVLAVFAGSWWAAKNHKEITALVLMSASLILIGYSSYTMIYIRANQDPFINENDPSTPAKFVSYLEREQYGKHSILDRRGVWQDSKKDPAAHIADQVNSTWGYVWNYQIKYMYFRYFNWQFIGRIGDRVDFTQFYMLPFLLGLFGMSYHFMRDSKRGLVVLALFIMTGLAVVAYLNQPDPQPRERDYSYVASFMAFSLWIGIGASGIMELIMDKFKGSTQRIATYAAIVVLTLAIPIQMIGKNYYTHDRSGNYVAWDYSYNILQTCEPNAILFTNGDNDTFPLWYLQEVVGIRKDVRVVNLSLLNTHWYIKQLRDYEPQVLPDSFTDSMIDQLYPMRFEKQEVAITAPKTEQNPDGKIEFTMKPTYAGQGIRVQDIMILRLMEQNLRERPMYFAITVSSQNKINLNPYLRMDGLAMKIMPHRVDGEIAPDVLEENITENYQYRELGNPDVYFNDNIKNLLQNYRSTFMQLAFYYYQNNQQDKMVEILDAMNNAVPEETIPYTNQDIYLEIARLYAEAGRTDILRERLQNALDNPGLDIQRRMRYASLYITTLNDFEKADSIFTSIYQQNPDNGQVIGTLLQIYERQGRWREAYEIINQWVQDHPNDQNARNMLEEYRTRMDAGADTTG
ncbi:MAG: DUF2723 domain-containing protein [Candidatus Marinimicrobia bacterium]|nr:DUF2723 domain-containing protein [Candidatus Neomarinimicrobiota bacterium]MCF7828437.1 DUF2723 domain-containing protein [Candidatus Neomarinimicrobiota bacterium]MCF7880969.1 DUF2723 domain-containing protein [Candidatus Neomarinimicrobiota bacterium]